MEPDFIWQTAEAYTDEAKRAWWQARGAEAKDAGAVLVRCSYHPTVSGLILCEAWKARPSDQGDIRWQLAA